MELIVGAIAILILVGIVIHYYRMKKNYEFRIDLMEQSDRRASKDSTEQCERIRILTNKYLFLVKQLSTNPGRIIDLVGFIQGTSENPEGPINWAVETIINDEDFREICLDFKRYNPRRKPPPHL